ncbi:hypothetical protein D9M71_649930 [compost metagenome]
MQDVPAQAKLFQHAGAEVLDQDVRFTEQFLQDRQAVRMLEVERQRFFIASLDEPPQRGALVQLAPFAQWIAAVRRFDLDHIGTEFSANARGERAGDQGTQFDDFQT